MDGVDGVAMLAASGHRATILAALHEDGPLSKDDLVERTGAARVSVGRNLDRLSEGGVVAEVEGGYRLTLRGDMVVEPFLAAVDAAALAADLGPLLEHLPPGEFELDPRALSDAEVTAATRADPYAPVERHAAAVAEADRYRGLLPAVGASPMEESADRVLDGELTVELVASAAVVDAMRSPEYADALEPMLAVENFSLLVYDGAVPYFLGLVDGTVQLGVDDDGVPAALAESDAPEVVEWAERTYERYRSAAEPVEALDPDEG